MQLLINGEYYEVEVGPDETLLHVLRDHLNLMGSTSGHDPNECCGSCAVLINGRVRSSCTVKAVSLSGDRVRTIEGIPEDHPVRNAWQCEGVEACDHCGAGQIMKTVSLLGRMLNPSPEDIKEALNTDKCKCGENLRIIRAVNKASKYSYDS